MTNPNDDPMSQAILKEIEKRLSGMFVDGVLVDISAQVEAGEFILKARRTSDPLLRAGYEELAAEAGEK